MYAQDVAEKAKKEAASDDRLSTVEEGIHEEAGAPNAVISS